VAVVAARFNPELVDALLARALARLRAAGVGESHLWVERVPGTGELPWAAQALARAGAWDVVLALGVVIRGDTIHYQLVAETAQQGLARVALDERVPVIAGIVVAENYTAADARCRGEIDRGAEFALAALEMGALKRRLSS
jgi:6,7-dimethyl-8-ribityllumazine synthase